MEQIFLNKHGTVAEQQDLFNSLAAVAMRKDIEYARRARAGCLDMLNNYLQDLRWLKRGMSEQASEWLQSLEESVKHLQLKVQLYDMIIEEKRK